MQPGKCVKIFLLLATVFGALVVNAENSDNSKIGVPVTYQLPIDGKLPKTYLVSLAITEKSNPNWIISTFVAGQPRTVTAENKGKFTEIWNGLDDNFMPVPPGEYGVKGIYAPARKWPVDGQWHAITAKYNQALTPWFPSPETPEYWKIDVPFGGDPVGSPFRDVDVAPNGIAAFYYQYLENGKNCPMFDLNKPVNHQQFLRAFNSGGAAGGTSVATDGRIVWAYSTDGGVPFVYRTDQKSFGTGNGAHRKHVFIPEGRVSSMAAYRDPVTGKSTVYVAQLYQQKKVADKRHKGRFRYQPDPNQFANKITVHNGDNGKVLQTVEVSRPQSIQVRKGFLYVLQSDDKSFSISRFKLEGGLAKTAGEKVLSVPKEINPVDMELDNSGRFYLSDSQANKVYQLNAKGKILRTWGTEQQKPGKYNEQALMRPEKLATWTGKDGKDRLIIVEMDGPNRVAEWSADTGKLLRTMMPFQTKANGGYAIDPQHPNHVYMPGQRNWLIRYDVDFDKRKWRVDSVWPDVISGQRKGLDKPDLIHANDTLYLASSQSMIVYRYDKKADRWWRSAGVLRERIDNKWQSFFWSDTNGNGEQDKSELKPMTLPGHVITYHGQRWLPDFTYIAPAQRGRDVWSLKPAKFDKFGNPVFQKWQKVLTDPIFEARHNGKPDALHGGNELTDNYNSDWMQADGRIGGDVYVHARGGKNFTANFGAQYKISHYIPDGKGGYKIKWRVGRAKLGSAEPRGEIIGGMRLFKPFNGILTLIDQSRSGLYLYTDDGMYIDTIFPPGSTREKIGVYRQPGEFFAGLMFSDSGSGKVYYGGGKYTPMFYEMDGWSLKSNPVKKLTGLPKKVAIKAPQIASPPEIALSLRGGAGKTNIASFSPALGGVKLDELLDGWKAAKPVQYGKSKEQNVAVQCLYDPNHLYLRWHVRLGSDFNIKPLPPLERIFTHDQQSDTVSFYFQGDVNAPAKGPKAGRPGDVRMIFGIFKDGDKVKPVAVGLYPKWKGKGAQQQIYRTPVGEAIFQYVGPVPGAKLKYRIDKNNKGFVIVAAIPRSAIPAVKRPFSGKFRTMVNFSANLGGNNKFWWANSDGSANVETFDEPSEARLYPGSWAPAQFQGITDGFAVPNWLVVGPFGGPGAEKFCIDPPGKMKDAVRKFYSASTYPPDNGVVNPKAVFTGPMIQGYWRPVKKITWKPAAIRDMDTRVFLGNGGQAWYGATWIYCPEEMTLDLEFQNHVMTKLTWWVNDQPLKIPSKSYKETNRKNHCRVASRKLTLKKGWNQIMFRGHNWGYYKFYAGLVVKGTPKQLWNLRFSGYPPKE